MIPRQPSMVFCYRKVPIPAGRSALTDERRCDDNIPFCICRQNGVFYFLGKGGEMMIQVVDVVKTFPGSSKGVEVHALQGVSFEVKKGDIFGIVGHSGAGKSTLLRLLNGLEKPTSGSVIVDEKEISNLNSKELRLARQKIGMIFQHFHLLWSRTVRENIAFPLEIASLPKAEIKRKVDNLLELVGLTDRADAYPSQLSGGQKQRVGIARALANDPHVLLCDEATSALDPETTASILRLLKKINQETGITLVLITHEMSVVQSICNCMAVLADGKIVEMGEVSAIFRAPKHPVTQKFLKELRIDLNKDTDEAEKSIAITSNQWLKLQAISKEAGVRFQVNSGTIDQHQEELMVQIIGSDEQVKKALVLLGRGEGDVE